MSSVRLEHLVENVFLKLHSNVAVEYYYQPDKESRKILKKCVLYGDLRTASTQLSSYLTDDLKVEKANACGVFMDSCIELPVCVFGVLRAYCIYVPLDKVCTPESMRKKIDAIGMRIVIAAAENSLVLQESLKDLSYELTVFQANCGKESIKLYVYKIAAAEKQSSIYQAIAKRNEVAFIMCTSGTTGEPKIIAVPHSCIVPNIEHISRIFGIDARSKIAMSAPPTFDPSVVEMFITFANGATLVVPSKSIKVNPHWLLEVLFRRAKITCLQATPSSLKRFTIEDLREKVFNSSSSLRIMAFGGETCPSYSTIKSWIKCDDMESTLHSMTFFNMYGITEISCWATCHQLSASDILLESKCDVPIGDPLLETTLCLRNATGHNVLCTFNGPTHIDGGENCDTFKLEVGTFEKYFRTGAEGRLAQAHLYIGGQTRLCHILGQEDTSYRFSGDLVNVQVASGVKCEIYFDGRIDSIVKRNGKRVNLKQVSEGFEGLPGVRSCNVMKEDICIHGKVVQMMVAFVTKEHDRACQNETLIMISPESKRWAFDCFQAATKVLEPDMVPDHVLLINCVPVTKHGKVDEKNLIGLLKKHRKSGHLTPVAESVLLGALQQVLPHCLKSAVITKLDFEKGFHELLKVSFSQLGGSSLEAIALITWLEEFLGFPIVPVIPDVLMWLFTFSLEKFISRLHDALSSESLTSKKFSPCATKRKNSTFPEEREEKRILRSDVSDCSSTFGRLGITEQWKYNTGQCVDASPLVLATSYAEKVCFIGSHSHLFSAVSMKTGTMLWNRLLADRIESSACLSFSNNVAVGCYDGDVYFLDVHTGDVSWRFSTGAQVKCSPCGGLANSCAVYVGSHDGHMYALDGKRQICLWKTYCGGGAIFSSPCVHRNRDKEDVIYFGTLGGCILSARGKSGEIIWKSMLGKPVFSSPCVSSHGVFVGCVDNSVYMLHLDSGEKVWSFETRNPVFSSPCLSLDEKSVLIGSHDGCLYNISASKGCLLWKSANLGSAIYSSPFQFCIAGSEEEYVAFATTTGVLRIADMKNGFDVVTKKLPGEVFSSPFVVSCKEGEISVGARNVFAEILIGCRDDHLYCYALTKS